jgi:hypothetical protein
MSVSTPILTTSSEICALATPPDTAYAMPAINVAASDFMVSSPLALVEALFEPFFYPASDGSQSRRAVGV